MINDKVIQKPFQRGKIRKFLGKRYFILKRKWRWVSQRKNFAKIQSEQTFLYSWKSHSTILLRPLKGVEMQYQHNKITNLRLAIKQIDGLVIAPGEVFSLWYLVGKPSKRKGYLKGLVLQSGKIAYDYGGGLCQLGNLLYWMVIHTPLKIEERWRHGFDVFPDVNRKLPFGSGATLSYNYIDFQVKNTTDIPVQIKLWLTDERLHGEIRGEQELEFRYEPYEAYHEIKQQYWGGYSRHNQINRKVINKKTHEVIKDEHVVDNHALMMYNPLLES